MADEILYRPATADDIRPAYVVFSRSLHHYLFRQGLIDEITAKDPPIDGNWKVHSVWIEHLWGSAAQNWIAEDAVGRILGWGMSIERDGHLELTHLFVDPGVQAKGIGRGLLKRAFVDEGARHKVIVALQDPRALSLYLRSGVGYVTTSADFTIAPRRIAPATDLHFKRVGLDDVAVAAITAVEQKVLGFRRDADVRFLLSLRPAWVALRADSVVGFAFGMQPTRHRIQGVAIHCGPMAALDPDDLPAILDHVIDAAQDAGDDEFGLAVPLINHVAVAHLFARGGKIDPFDVKVLATDNSMRLDRWVHTRPPFIL